MHIIGTRIIVGTVRPILTIRHVTTYHYKQPVAFGEHRMMLRPRDDNDQKVLESELEIMPEPTQLTWTQDIFGNHVAAARFADRASELRFESTIHVDHTPARLCNGQISALKEDPREGFGSRVSLGREFSLSSTLWTSASDKIERSHE